MDQVILRLDNVHKWFGGLHAVDGVSGQIEPGEIVALIGPNGAGKTTLLNLIAAVFPATSGSIHLLGQDMKGFSVNRLACAGVGRSFQTSKLFESLTVADNVLAGFYQTLQVGLFNSMFRPVKSRKRMTSLADEVNELLAFVGFHKDPMLSAMDITYGEKRLVEIARAIASKPKLLLLDEPAAGLNTMETRELAAVIRNIRSKGTTVLVVEHDMELVQLVADRVWVLDAGRMTATGKPADVLSDRQVIEAYLGRDDSDAET